jgi:hypothetical protein
MFASLGSNYIGIQKTNAAAKRIGLLRNLCFICGYQREQLFPL